MNASSTARFDREPQECAFGAWFRPSNLGIEWNAENQLKKVLKNSATIVTFAYDPLGRRVEKIAGGTTTTFTYDGEDILRQTSGGTTTYFVHGPGIDEPLAKEISGTTTYYHADALGSILKATDAAGEATYVYRYDPYGRIEFGNSTPGYSYAGREWDPELELYYYRARYYDPVAGRFISEDPLGLRGGANLTSYVANNPVRWIDPLGLSKITNSSGGPIRVKGEQGNNNYVTLADGESATDVDGAILGDEVFKVNPWTDVTVTADENGDYQVQYDHYRDLIDDSIANLLQDLRGQPRGGFKDYDEWTELHPDWKDPAKNPC